MEKMKLIAMDMDGTLLDDAQRIPDENLAALREAAAQGVHIAICSGRAANDLSYYASDAGLADCHILALNGACCLDKPHGTAYALHVIAEESAARVTDTLLRHNVHFAAFQQNRLIVVPGSESIGLLEWGSHVMRDGPQAVAYGQEALVEYRAEGICKIVYIDMDHAPRIEEIRQELAPIPGIVVTSSWSNNLEIMPVDVHKGQALQALAERLGVQREAVMALGDYDNDLEMLQYAGMGIAMANASDAVKQVAQWVTLSNVECGVAAAIRKYVLNPA